MEQNAQLLEQALVANGVPPDVATHVPEGKR
jgi:hypothetical protein